MELNFKPGSEVNPSFAPVLDGYRSLGMYEEGEGEGKGAGGRGGIFLSPFAMSVDDMEDGEALAAEEPRIMRGLDNRLEEVRQLAIQAGVPEERTTDESGFKTRLFTFTGSDESVDRYGCRILINGTWDGQRFGKGWVLTNYRRAPRFMPFHAYDTIPAGRSLDTWTDKKGERNRLRFQILMDEGPAGGGASPIAPALTNAYRSRLMESVSVGWWPVDVHFPKDEEERKALGLGRYGVIFGTSELWELSAVAIPGNPNARMENAVGDDAKGRFTELSKLLEKDGGEQGKQMAAQIRSALDPKPKSKSTITLNLTVPATEPTPTHQDGASGEEAFHGLMGRLSAAVQQVEEEVSKVRARGEEATSAFAALAPRLEAAVIALERRASIPSLPVAPAGSEKAKGEGTDPYAQALSIAQEVAEKLKSAATTTSTH